MDLISMKFVQATSPDVTLVNSLCPDEKETKDISITWTGHSTGFLTLLSWFAAKLYHMCVIYFSDSTSKVVFLNESCIRRADITCAIKFLPFLNLSVYFNCMFRREHLFMVQIIWTQTTKYETPLDEQEPRNSIDIVCMVFQTRIFKEFYCWKFWKIYYRCRRPSYRHIRSILDFKSPNFVCTNMQTVVFSKERMINTTALSAA